MNQKIQNKYEKNQLTNLNLILQRNIEIYKYTNNIETQTKKSVNDFCSSRPVQLFSSLWIILVWSQQLRIPKNVPTQTVFRPDDTV